MRESKVTNISRWIKDRKIKKVELIISTGWSELCEPSPPGARPRWCHRRMKQTNLPISKKEEEDYQKNASRDRLWLAVCKTHKGHTFPSQKRRSVNDNSAFSL